MPASQAFGKRESNATRRDEFRARNRHVGGNDAIGEEVPVPEARPQIGSIADALGHFGKPSGFFTIDRENMP